MSAPSTPEFVLPLLSASQLVPRGIDWLWAGRLWARLPRRPSACFFRLRQTGWLGML
jgi:hypothetical protein